MHSIAVFFILEQSLLLFPSIFYPLLDFDKFFETSNWGIKELIFNRIKYKSVKNTRTLKKNLDF